MHSQSRPFVLWQGSRSVFIKSFIVHLLVRGGYSLAIVSTLRCFAAVHVILLYVKLCELFVQERILQIITLGISKSSDIDKTFVFVWPRQADISFGIVIKFAGNIRSNGRIARRCLCPGFTLIAKCKIGQLLRFPSWMFLNHQRNMKSFSSKVHLAKIKKYPAFLVFFLQTVEHCSHVGRNLKRCVSFPSLNLPYQSNLCHFPAPSNPKDRYVIDRLKS